MPYTPTTWVDDDGSGSVGTVITAARLNNLESGIVAAAGETLSPRPILDVGSSGQTRAGRVLTATDFTELSVTELRGLWNLGDLTDVSGNSRTLVNKGSVTFGSGITGAATEAAVFTGSTSQALYFDETGLSIGGGDEYPFRFRTGTWGAWFRTAKTGVQQSIITKYGAVGGLGAWALDITSTDQIRTVVSTTGSDASVVTGLSRVNDDRWHFGVSTYDGHTIRIYVDGEIEGAIQLPAATNPLPLNPSTGPLNIGGMGGTSSTNPLNPFFGRIDEAFAAAQVLSLEQIRGLYAIKIPHSLAVVPTGVRMSVTRNRRGAAFATTDFPSTPKRLYNFTSTTTAPTTTSDQGSDGVALTVQNSAVPVAGADGQYRGAFHFNGTNQYANSTDTGLPTGTATRSIGAWFKLRELYYIAMYGSTRFGLMANGLGTISLYDGSTDATATWANVWDGQWHFAVGVADNSAVDGLKRKIYLDGRLIGGATTFNATVLGGANAFNVGKDPTAATYTRGAIDGVFLCDYALTADQVLKLYAKSSQQLPASPRDAAAHIEAVDDTNIWFVGDTIEPQNEVTIGLTG